MLLSSTGAVTSREGSNGSIRLALSICVSGRSCAPICIHAAASTTPQTTIPLARLFTRIPSLNLSPYTKTNSSTATLSSLRHLRQHQMHMLDRSPLPRVRHLQITIRILNHRRVRVLARSLLQRRKHAEVLSIAAHRKVQRRPSAGSVVEDHHHAPILQRHCIQP